MRTTRRTEFLIVAVAVLAMSAGVVAGLLASRLPASAKPPPSGGGPDSVEGGQGGQGGASQSPASFERTLADELALDDRQREQMREIWEAVRETVHGTFTEAQALQKQRDHDLVALLNEEQKAKFEKIAKDYADRFTTLTRKRDATFDAAVERTRVILKPEQRQRYDQLLKEHVRRRPPDGAGGPPPPPPPPPGGAGATTSAAPS